MFPCEATKSAILDTYTQTLGARIPLTNSETTHGCSIITKKCCTEVRVGAAVEKMRQIKVIAA